MAKKSDDWMFGDAGLPKKPAAPPPTPDVTQQKTDRLEAIQPNEPKPVAKPAAAPVKPPEPARAAPPSEADKLKQKVLDHTAKLRRALLEGTPPPPEGGRAGVGGTPPAKAPSPLAHVAPAPPPPAPAAPHPNPPPAARGEGAAAPAPRAEGAAAPAERGEGGQPDDDTAALKRALIEKTRTTTLKDLERKGMKQVQVINMAIVEQIVGEAVTRVVEKRHLGAREKKAIEQDAKREFLELMDEHKRALAAKSDEERKRADLERQVDKLRLELLRQEEALSEQRESARIAISAESLRDLETSCKKVLGEFMNDERRTLVADKNPKAEEGLGELEKKLGEVFDRLVGRLKSDYEDLLERRIEKLNKALSETENALRHMAQMKSIDPGIASIYRTVQGLALDEDNYERKKELLAIVFLENLQLQHKEITEKDREAAVIRSTLEPSRDEAPQAPEGFEPPLDPLTTETAF